MADWAACLDGERGLVVPLGRGCRARAGDHSSGAKTVVWPEVDGSHTTQIAAPDLFERRRRLMGDCASKSETR